MLFLVILGKGKDDFYLWCLIGSQGGSPYPFAFSVRQHKKQQTVLRAMALLWWWTNQFLWFHPAVADCTLQEYRNPVKGSARANEHGLFKVSNLHS